ncbi:Protein GrpE [Buchnera aphidicola (Cinara kochiana kochiana)]|uniref:Protein GrpE n=1 Tax=Buchnera aphidicola (Cinara kochiana kochiana) TaxID=2518976 RepID=A0A451D5F7_9GAMM|nr:nucleotide exchange factor GrpE [Buchnera aphidicola]VFP81079.1 Protein GrpE [Buchnera aphidicola (Cinara kochiana kochiana)]
MKCNDILNNSSLDHIKKELINKELKKNIEYLEKKKLKVLDLKNDILKHSKLYADKLLKLEKRLQKKIYNTYNFFLEKYFISILPIVDSIDSSVNLLDSLHQDNSNDIYISLKNIQKNFFYLFTQYKISVIESTNIPFNPDLHQAISIDFSGKYKNNFISCIIQKGYSINNRLLRPALVSVSQIK